MINSQTHPSPDFITGQDSLRTERWRPAKVMVWVGVEDRKICLLDYVMFLPSFSQCSEICSRGERFRADTSYPNLERINMVMAGRCDVMEFCALPAWKCRLASSLISLTFTRREWMSVKDWSPGETHACVQQQELQSRGQRRWWWLSKWKNTPKSEEEEWYLHNNDNTIFAGWRDESSQQPPASQVEARRIDSEDDGAPAPVRALCLPWLGSDSSGIMSNETLIGLSSNCHLFSWSFTSCWGQSHKSTPIPNTVLPICPY